MRYLKYQTQISEQNFAQASKIQCFSIELSCFECWVLCMMTFSSVRIGSGLVEMSFLNNSDRFGLPEALTTGAIVQTLVDVNIALEAKILFAFWAGNTRPWHVSCIF